MGCCVMLIFNNLIAIEAIIIMSNDVKISIIVPVYNVQKYLSRCLDSLVNQTILSQPASQPAIEIICVNDASTDQSLEILKKYHSTYPALVKVIDLPVNKKQGGARNAGLDIAVGEYIGFVDSDDWVELDMYEQLYALAKNSEYDVVDCDYNDHDGSEVLKRQCSIHPNHIVPRILKDELFISYGRLWSKLFKRKFFSQDSLNIRFPEGIFYEDNYIQPLLVINTASIGKVNLPLYNYFISPDSTTRTKNNIRMFDRVVSAEKMLHDVKLNFPDAYHQHKEAIDWRFHELAIVNTVFQVAGTFDYTPVENFKKVKSLSRLINIKFNHYYKQLGLKRKLLVNLATYIPDVLIFILRSYHRLKNCS